MLHNPATVALMFSIFITVIFVSLVVCLDPPPPIIVIKAESEFLAFKVIRPELSVIAVENATSRREIETCEKIKEGIIEFGLLEPLVDSLVQYRYNGEYLSIIITTPEKKDDKLGSYIRFPDKTKCKLPPTAIFLLDKPEEGSFSSRPLPVAGPGQIGVELGSPTLPQAGKVKRRLFNIMTSGKLKVYGRTRFPLDSGILYPIEDTEFDLPAGGRLSSGGETYDSPEINNEAAIYGVVLLGEKSFFISAITETNELRWFRPGGSSDSEKFAVSIFSRLFDDPSVAVISFSILFFSLTMQVICGWIDICKNDK